VQAFAEFLRHTFENMNAGSQMAIAPGVSGKGQW
jgi:hypothetical protein